MAIKLRLESKGIKNELSDINRLIEKMEGQHTLNIAGQAKLEALNKVAKELNKELVKMYEDKATKSNPYLRTQQNLEKLKRTTQEYIQLKKKESDGTITQTEVAQLKQKEKIIRTCNQQIGKYGTESQKAYRNEINSSKQVQISIQNETKAIKQKAEAQQQAARQEEANQKRIAQLKKDYEKSVNTEKSYVKKQEKSDHYNKAGVKQTNSEEFNTNEALKVERDLQTQILQQLRERGVAENEINELIRTRNNQIGYQQKTVSQKAQYEDAIKLTKEQYEIEKRLINLKADPKQTKFHQEEIAALEKELEATKKLKEEKLAVNENGTELTQDQKKYQQELESSLQRSNELYKAQRKDIVNAKNATSELGDTIKKVFNYVLVYKGFQLLSQGIQQAIDTMKELDKAFTDIQMVTGDSDEATAELAQEYNALAKQMGSTTQEVAEGASEWLRQGKTASETTELLKASMTLSKVGAIESSQATELLTSSLNGYKVAAEDAMSIVDKISAIDLEAATSSEELAVALARTANSANDAGVSFDKLLAMIGTTSSVTRKSASTIGESFKTIFARMSNVAAGKDTDDEGESLNDVEKTLTKLDIKLRDSVGQWRSFEEVLDEVAEKWNNGVFNDVEKSQVATAIAGVRQQENFRALMNNWDEVQRLTNVAADSTGSASQKMETYLDSVEAKTNELKATWEEFVMNLNQSDSYKGFLDLCIWILNNFPTIIGYFTSLIVIFKGDTISKKISLLVEGLGSLKGKFTDIKKDLDILRLGWYRNADGILTVASAQETAAATTSMLQLGLGALIAVVTAGIQIYNSWKQANVEAAEAASKEAEAHQSKIDAMENAITKYSEIYNSTASYTTKQEELNQLSEDLTESYGKEAEALDLLNGKYSDNIKAMEDKANAERKQQLSDLKTASDKGEANLDNWTNHMMDVVYETDTYDVTEENKEALQKIKDIAGDKVKFVTNKSKHSEMPTQHSTYTVSNLDDLFNSGLLTNGADIKGFTMSNSATNEEGLKIAQDLEEYIKENADDIEQPILDMVNGFISQIRSEVDKDAEGQFENKQKYQLAKATQNSDGSRKQEIKDYEAQLSKQQELEKQYNEETNAQKKEQLKEQLAEEYKLTEEALNKVKGLYTGGEDQSTLSQQKILDYLGFGEDATNLKNSQSTNVYSTLNDTQIETFKNLREEIQNTDVLSADLVTRIQEFRKELQDAGKEEALKNFDEEMKNLNVQILEGVDNYKSLKDKYKEYLDQKITFYNQNENGEVVAEEGNDYNKYVRFIEEDLKKTLEMNGVKFSDDWYNSLKEQLEKGEISGLEFFNKLSEAAKGFGVDLDEPIKKMEELNNQSFDGILGSQEEFVKEMDNIDSLYEDATNIKSGKTLDNDRIVELRNEYEDLNEYIAETGDLTLKNGQLLTDIANTTYEDGEKALDGQISALEDYQDAILNTVDAMGIMAEFKEELAKIDSDLAETITDNAIAEAEAKGMYVDVAKATSDGVYDANETLEISEDNLLTKTQAAAQGIFDSKSTEMEIAQNMATASIEANDAIQNSEYATAEQKVQASEWAGNAKAAEAEITSGAAETESIAEGSSAQASAEGAEAKADSQSIAAQAAITTGQAFLQMAQAIAEAEGVETGSLNAAGEKLAGLQGQLDSLNADNASNAQKAAAAYKEAQAKIQEAKARLNSYKSANKTGKSNYNVAKPSGSSSGSKGSGYSAEDAADDLKDILEDIEDYEADIELNLEDQTEQLINHYNLEKNKLESLKEELDYYEGIYDSVENTTKWLETQSKLLENQSDMVEELQKSNDKIEKQREKIYRENSGYNVSGWFDSEGNDTLAYGDLINSFEYQKNAIQKETAAQMRDVYNSVAGSTSEDAIENAKDRIEELQKAADKRLEALDKEREKVENIHDSVSELNDAWDENQEAIRDALADMHDRIIDMRDTLVDQMMEQLEKAVDKQNESIEKDVTRMEQLVSIREKYYDILNETIDTQAELDSELQSSLDSFEYLDEQMRQLMFNEEDYKVLSETLTGIQEDIADIWEDHYAQIDSLTDDEMYKAEYITAETERQLEMKMQEYELAKAELDVAKARTNLQNVQNERNVRMFVNGQWTWVADPDAVKDAQQQLADAEREKNRIEREAEQQRLIDSMDKIIDSDNLQIDENNELLERVQEAIELQTQEVQSIEQALENIANTDLPAVGDVLQGAFGADGKSGWISELLQNINKSTSGLTLALKGYTVASAENALKNGSLSKSEFNDLVSKLGYSFNETTGIVTTPEGSFSAHYKGWTQKNNNDVQLGTANNGVQVTGGGSNANGSGGGSSASGFPRSGHVSTSSLPLRIRSGAGTNYKVLGLMPKGAAVTITGEANSGWAKVQYNGINGYASRQYLTYDQGGVAIGKGMFLKDVNVPERILSPKQTKSFDYLVKNLTTNPVLAALTKNPNITSNLNGLGGAIGETKQYYFSNFTVQADNLTEFIDSLDAMIPISRK